jgi:hypothetical protein
MQVISPHLLSHMLCALGAAHVQFCQGDLPLSLLFCQQGLVLCCCCGITCSLHELCLPLAPETVYNITDDLLS